MADDPEKLLPLKKYRVKHTKCRGVSLGPTYNSMSLNIVRADSA